VLGYGDGLSPDRAETGQGPKTAFSTKEGHWKYRTLPVTFKDNMYILMFQEDLKYYVVAVHIDNKVQKRETHSFFRK
jgi:hypothetical protein